MGDQVVGYPSALVFNPCLLLAVVGAQDRLLFVAFYVLLNLAEDVAVERKMVKKGLLEYFLGEISLP